MTLLQSTLHFTASEKSSSKRKPCSFPYPSVFSNLELWCLQLLLRAKMINCRFYDGNQEAIYNSNSCYWFCSRIMANLKFKPFLLMRRGKTTRTREKKKTTTTKPNNKNARKGKDWGSAMDKGHSPGQNQLSLCKARNTDTITPC